LKITDDVYWTGVLDSELVSFDIVMETRYGTTYNSYLINASKKTLIDTVKLEFWPEYREKLLSLTDPSDIEFIVCNHTEPDHSGSLGHLLELAPDATVVGSGQALAYLNEMVGRPFKSLRVKDGDSIDLGNKTLKIIGAPNLHWPDTIYSWLEEDGILFTCDSLGSHYADPKMWDDEVEDFTESFEYYFDVILKPYSKFMLKAMEKVSSLPVRMVCPGHGPLLRSTWKDKMDRSVAAARKYLEDTTFRNRVLVAYVSAYGYTKRMAEQVSEGLKKSGKLEVELVDIENILLGDLEEYMVKADALLVGSPTINKNTLLPVYRLFSVINPIRDKGKPAAAFGSFGWSGEAVGLIENHLGNLKLNIVAEGIAARFLPGEEESASLVKFGEEFARAMDP